jgi:hypothetical protein
MRLNAVSAGKSMTIKRERATSAPPVKRKRDKVMAYKYEHIEFCGMSTQKMLDAITAREIPPRWVVGTGYKDSRKVAIEYLTERLEQEKEGEQ